MKKWIKAVAFSLALIFAIPVTVPQCDQTVVQAATKKPKLNVKVVKLKVGETYNLKIKNPGKNKWKWTSTNKKVATVDKNGVVTAKSIGVTDINVSCRDYYLFCKIWVKSAFDQDEAKEKITLTPVSADNTFYKVTSTYEIPTYVTVNYKIIDKDGVTISKSSTSVLAIPWGDTYIKIPSTNNNQTIQLSYSYAYARGSSISKENYDNLLNSIQIIKYEDTGYRGGIIRNNTCYLVYDIYLKNITSKKVNGSIGFLIYDDKGELLPHQENSHASINIDPGETVKESITILQEVKNDVNPYKDLTNVGDIKFYVAGM